MLLAVQLRVGGLKAVVVGSVAADRKDSSEEVDAVLDLGTAESGAHLGAEFVQIFKSKSDKVRPNEKVSGADDAETGPGTEELRRVALEVEEIEKKEEKDKEMKVVVGVDEIKEQAGLIVGVELSLAGVIQPDAVLANSECAVLSVPVVDQSYERAGFLQIQVIGAVAMF